ncbi:MAG TPA: BlaI/MecI/CopY family transcriptional regulator [Bryobacteraceae bacterium]|nr:BlaI/MecI/CopY family transcriptional regulator [Bryobacteraceae bacterium]
MARAAAARELPPRLELLCLKALWRLGEGRVTDVHRLLSQQKPLAYTTVLTLLDRLARKGVVTRRKIGRAYMYAPQLTQDSLRRIALRDFLENYFDGSTDRLLDLLREAPPATAPVISSLPDGRLDTALL